MTEEQHKSPERISREAIAKRERDGAASLDLSGLGLTVLPAKIGRLTSLTNLYLANNKLTTLPAAIMPSGSSGSSR